jgi:hypothetical protein
MAPIVAFIAWGACASTQQAEEKGLLVSDSFFRVRLVVENEMISFASLLNHTKALIRLLLCMPNSQEKKKKISLPPMEISSFG